MKHLSLGALLSLFSSLALADSHDPLAPTGDAVAGENAFKRQCSACHVAADADGNILAGKRSKTGPNLYDLMGKPAGGVEGYRYSKAMIAAGADAGLTWTNETFTAYVQDPTGYLREVLDHSRARAKMSFKVRKEQDALDIYAFLHSLSN